MQVLPPIDRNEAMQVVFHTRVQLKKNSFYSQHFVGRVSSHPKLDESRFFRPSKYRKQTGGTF